MSSINFTDMWASTPVEDRGGNNLGPGRYTAKVVSAETRTSKNGNYGVVFRLVSTEPGTEGDSTIVSAYLTEKSQGLFVKTLSSFGITGEMMEADDVAAIQTAVGQVWNITVAQQKGSTEYTNTYLNKRVDTDGDAPAAEAADTGAPTPPKPSGSRPF